MGYPVRVGVMDPDDAVTHALAIRMYWKSGSAVSLRAVPIERLH